MLLISPESLKQAQQALSQCDYLRPIIQQQGDCTINPLEYDPFDALVSTIIGQQLSVKAAATIEARVRALVGEVFIPEAILSASVDSLRYAGLSRRKVEYIQGIATSTDRGELDFHALQTVDDQEVIRQLVTLRGVGQWTAEMFMIFVLGRTDIFSSLDVGLQRGMRLLFRQQDLSLKQMEVLAQRWQPYRSVASWYLWRVVD